MVLVWDKITGELRNDGEMGALGDKVDYSANVITQPSKWTANEFSSSTLFSFNNDINSTSYSKNGIVDIAFTTREYQYQSAYDCSEDTITKSCTDYYKCDFEIDINIDISTDINIADSYTYEVRSKCYKSRTEISIEHVSVTYERQCISWGSYTPSCNWKPSWTRVCSAPVPFCMAYYDVAMDTVTYYSQNQYFTNSEPLQTTCAKSQFVSFDDSYQMAFDRYSRPC